MAEEPGSLLLAPVDTELRLYERKRDGGTRFTVVSSVRFSELEVRFQAGGALLQGWGHVEGGGGP
jgi:hypothetical protein